MSQHRPGDVIATEFIGNRWRLIEVATRFARQTAFVLYDESIEGTEFDKIRGPFWSEKRAREHIAGAS